MRRIALLLLVIMLCIIIKAQENKAFLQLSVTETSFYSNQERGMNLSQGLFGGFRSTAGVSMAIGKWVSPQIGLRLKLNGFGYRTVISDDGNTNASRYAALFGDVMLNASNLFLGDCDKRCWNVVPYVGGGINRNFTYDEYGIGLRLGLENCWHLTNKWSVHMDISYSIYEPDTDGVDLHIYDTQGKSRHTLDNRDRSIGVELGLTYFL